MSLPIHKGMIQRMTAVNQIREVYEELKTSIRKDKTHDTEREIP
jgi:hypothetical protein